MTRWAITGEAWGETPVSQAAEGTGNGRSGGCVGSPRRHVPVGVHRSIGRARLGAARVPEEVEERHRHAESGHRADQAAPEAGRRNQQEEGVDRWRGRTTSSGVATSSRTSASASGEASRRPSSPQDCRSSPSAGDAGRAANVLKIDRPTGRRWSATHSLAFSLDRLVRLLVLLGSDVEIVVKPRTGRRAVPGCWSPENLSEVCILFSDSRREVTGGRSPDDLQLAGGLSEAVVKKELRFRQHPPKLLPVRGGGVKGRDAREITKPGAISSSTTNPRDEL